MIRSACLLVLSVFLALECSTHLAAQTQCPADTPDYELSAASGTPSPLTKNFNYTRKNKSSVTIRLKDINPYHYKCGVSVTSTDVKEPDISGFTSLIGGVASNPGAAIPATANPTPTPKPASTPAGGPLARIEKATAPRDCYNDYQPTHAQVVYLHDVATLVTNALQQTHEAQDAILNRLQGDLSSLRGQSSCTQTVQQAGEVIGRPSLAIATVPMPSPPPSGEAYLTAEAHSLDQAVDSVFVKASLLAQHLTDKLNDQCRSDYSKHTQEDLAFLNALTIGGASTPAAVSTWRDQLNAFKTVQKNIKAAQTSVKVVLDNPENFTITRTIDGDQQIVTYTAKCDPVPEITVASPTSAASSAQPQPSPSPSPSPTPSTTWSHDYKFGLGPRFALAGGLVISPLSQVTFSTTANPAAAGTGSTAPANVITKQQDSSTRILPIAMLHGRFWDNLPDCGKNAAGLAKTTCVETYVFPWIPSYFSAGVTAKSTDNNGTSIEYLFGPSWALVNRQVFFTVGAYAGHQQRLANSLHVGDATALSAANLPLTQTTIWKAGFAITWAPGGK